MIDLVLVDFDDTLVVTEPRFQNARRALFRTLERAGFDPKLSQHLHESEVDPEMLGRYGLGPARLEHSFRETYARMCVLHGVDIDSGLADEVAEFGRAVAGPSERIDGALDALGRLAQRVHTVIYTQAGNHEYQLDCIRTAGVLEIIEVDRVRICGRKTAEEFRLTAEHFGAALERTWMIGNSIRSDINPALECGANAILVGNGPEWKLDHADPVSDDFIQVETFMYAVDYLLNELEGHAECR